MSQPHYKEFIFNNNIKSLIQDIDLSETDDTGITLLGVASYHNDYQLIKLLLQKGANVNLMDEHGNYPLGELLLSGENELDDPKILVSLELLLKAGANPNIVVGKKSLLNELLSEMEPPLTILEMLLKYGTEPNFGGSVQWHPITTVMDIDDPNYIISVLDLLLSYNADINIEDVDNHTPLTVASLLEDVDIMKFLLDKGANINHQNSKGNTSLMAQLNYEGNVGLDFLLAHGADVNLINNNGETALQIAIKKGLNRFQIIRIKKLLDAGAHKNEIININVWKNLYEYVEELNEINEQRIQEILELKKCDLGTILETNIGEYL